MNFNSILQLLDNGLSKDQVLAYLKNASPKIAKKVQQMLIGGYGAGEILKYLSQDPQTNHAKINKPYSSDDIANIAMIQNRMNVSQTRDEQALQELKKATPYVISAIGAIAPFAIGNKAIGEIGSAIAHQLPTPTPSQPIQPGPGIGQQLQQQAQAPVMGAMQPATQGQVAQASQAMQPTQQQPPQSIFDQLTSGIDLNSLDEEKKKQLQFLNLISDQLQSEGKPPEDPAFQKLAKRIKDVLKGNPGTIIRESSRSQSITPKDPNSIVENKVISTPAKFENTPFKQENLIDPISKGSSVITPSGEIATIEDLPGKTAKVNIDGKQQVHKTDDLVPIPENSNELGEIYQRLIDKIPEGHKSRVYDAIGYDPVRNAIKYTYHDGKTYIIDDVPEEIAKEIANSSYLAKTSGGNYMGLYYKGNPSIGAGMSVLINDLQKLRGGKGKEYSYKFEELYSQYRLPKNILKQKAELEKQREREEKKAKKKRSTS